jgi:hypothetical protein
MELCDPAKANMEVFSEEGLKEAGGILISGANNTSIGGKPLISGKLASAWSVTDLYENIINPSVKIGDYHVVINSTTNGGVDIISSDMYARDNYTMYTRDATKISQQGRYRGRAKSDFQFKIKMLQEGKLNFVVAR